MDLYQTAGLTGADGFSTERLAVRPLVTTDAQAIAEAFADGRVARQMPLIPTPYTLADAQDFIAAVHAKGSRDWAVCRDGVLVGGLSFNHELGFWLRPDQWRQGLASEMSHALLSRWFAQPGAWPARSSYFEGNDASKAVQARQGFAPLAGQIGPHIQTVLTPEQWYGLNPWIIRTERLTIAPLTTAHAAEFAAWSGIPEVARMTGTVLPGWTADQAAEWIERRRWRGLRGGVMGVWRVDRDALIGQVGMSHDDIGYMIAPDHWGQGYASEAAQGLLDAAIPRFGITQVVASAFQDNPASMRVLEKLGFEKFEEKEVQVPARLEPAMISKYRLTIPDGKR